LSIYYFAERVTFSDSGSYLAHILAGDGFAISMNSRFVGALTQIFPLIALKMHFSLKAILILYSINYSLIAIIPALISLVWFKETKTAWTILLFYILMAGMLFYYPVTEYQQGLCLFIFYLGYFEHFKKNKSSNLVLVLMTLVFIPTVIFSHPLSILVFFSWIVLSFFEQSEKKKLLFLPSIIAIISYLIKSKFFNIQYEEERSDIKKILLNSSLRDLYQRMGKSYLEFLIQDYFLLIVLFIVTIIFLALSRKKILATVFFFTIISWWLLITITYRNDRFSHYHEHLYQAIPLFISWAFCRFYLPNIKDKIQVIVIFVIVFISISKINSGSGTNTARIQWFKKCFSEMDKLNCQKAVYSYSQLPDQKDCYSIWSIPYESLLISALLGKDSCKSIFPIWSLDELKMDDVVTPRIDNFYEVKLVSKEYFNIPDRQYCIPENNMTIIEANSSLLYKK
jgi:hypothetical protein